MIDELGIDQGTTTATVRGYKPMATQRRPAAVLTIEGYFFDEETSSVAVRTGAEYKDWQDLLATKFHGDAKKVVDLLQNNLPGGTMHQILILMLKRAVSLYTVLDEPDTSIRDIAEAARDFVWAEQGELATTTERQNLWVSLCQIIEKRYGAAPEVRE